MDQITRDCPLDTISEINPTSSTPDDSFSKSPSNFILKSIAKLGITSNSNIEGSTRNIINRMQDEIEALLHENAELKSRGSAHVNDQNSNVHRLDKKNQKADYSLDREVENKNDVQSSSLREKNAVIQSLSEKVGEFQERINLLEKGNQSLQIEVKKRDNYLQQKLQLEIELRKNMRLNQELQAKLDVQEHVSTRQNSIIQDNSLVIEDVKSEIHEQFEKEICQKNKTIEKLDKENNLSKDMNKILVKLLKLKNLQIQANRILFKKEELEIDATKKNLEKFENEEKKLLRILETKMKQYGEIENEQEIQ